MSEPSNEKRQKPISPAKLAKEYLLSQIRKLAAMANVAVPEETIAVYASELATLTREQLDMATVRTIREWEKPSQMPTLAFILDRSGIDKTLLAEQAWELAWKLVRRDWYSDGIGWVNGAEKKLTPAMQYAIRQCGGEYRMAYCDEETFPFIRRDFLESHERFALEDGDQVRLTAGEAKAWIGQLQAAAVKEALPEIPEAMIPDPPIRYRPEPRQLTAAEQDDRIVELKRQAEDLKAKAEKV